MGWNMEIKTNILSLEEEMTDAEENSFQDEEENAKANYSALDDALSDAKRKIPFPEVNQYSDAIDYEDQEDLQSKKRINKRYEQKVYFLESYVNDGSLYCGHFKIGIEDVFVMDHSWHQSRHFKRKNGTEFFLLNVNDKSYQEFVNKWRFPSDHDDVILSRNIVLKNRKVTDVDVIFESDNANFSDITDKYLRKALLRNKDTVAAQGIIQTIQKKQDDIRTYNKNISFIVQGCAGSGKTMVLLHRLRYLLFNDEMHNGEYILLIPSAGFRNFINDLSQRFNISKSSILSYQEYYGMLLGKEILEDDIRDELVFDDEYLYTVYSKDLMQQCYRMFFKSIIKQTNDLISYCDTCLTAKQDEEKAILTNELEHIDDDVLNGINQDLSRVSTYIGIDKLESIDEVYALLDILQYEYQNRLTVIDTDTDEAVQQVCDVEEVLNNDVNLAALKAQIESERRAIEMASTFTKLSHKKKLEQLELRLDIQKQELIKSYSENEDSKRKNEAVKIKVCINKIIANKLKDMIDNINISLAHRKDKKAFMENVLNDLEDDLFIIYDEPIKLLNVFIEGSSRISNFESEFVEPLRPGHKKIHKIIKEGTEVATSFIQNGLFTKEDLAKKTRLFTQRTALQLTSYLYLLLYSSIKSEIYQRYKIKICKLYKHYWYLQLYSRYLVGGVDRKKYRYIFVDEAQDLSPTEIELIYKVNTIDLEGKTGEPVVDLFGDVNQTITEHGIHDWKALDLKTEIIELDENFRNTNQIIEYCNANLPFNMKKIGVDMDEVTVYPDIEEALSKNRMIKEAVIIVKDEFVKKDLVSLLDGMGWHHEYTVFTVKEAKGLEFKEVFVIDCKMNSNEKYVAYTRALAKLNIVHNIPLKKEHESLIINGDDEEESVSEEEIEAQLSDNQKNEANDEYGQYREFMELIPKTYRSKIEEIKCTGIMEGTLYLISYSGKLKKIDGINVEQHFIPATNKKGKESLIPISMDKDKHIAFITRNNFNSFAKELKSGKLLKIR